MDEYINRKTLQEAMEFVTNDTTCPIHIAAYIDQIIAQETAADVVKVNRGKWSFEHPNGSYYCSCCGKGIKIKYGERAAIQWDFCPNCGAKMKGE